MGRGLLLFKGDKASKTKKVRKSKAKYDKNVISLSTNISTKESEEEEAIAAPSTTISSSETTTTKIRKPTIEKGTGKITSSGTVLNGILTKFNEEISVGDAIMIMHPNTNQQEMRVITMCLSNVSCAISSPFSIDISEYIEFSYINAPSSIDDRRKEEERKKIKLKKDQEQIEKVAFGIYSGIKDGNDDTNVVSPSKGSGGKKSKELVYRIPTATGSYRIVREQVDGNVTRGDLLNLRLRKKSDKYC